MILGDWNYTQTHLYSAKELTSLTIDNRKNSSFHSFRCMFCNMKLENLNYVLEKFSLSQIIKNIEKQLVKAVKNISIHLDEIMIDILKEKFTRALEQTDDKGSYETQIELYHLYFQTWTLSHKQNSFLLTNMESHNTLKICYNSCSFVTQEI